VEDSGIDENAAEAHLLHSTNSAFEGSGGSVLRSVSLLVEDLDLGSEGDDPRLLRAAHFPHLPTLWTSRRCLDQLETDNLLLQSGHHLSLDLPLCWDGVMGLPTDSVSSSEL
jgi:hypothetical protein